MKYPLKVAALIVSALLAYAPAFANEVITTQPIQQGQLVYPVDMNDWAETSRNETGLLSTAIAGAQNVRPAVNPLTIALSGSNMTFSIGGSGQAVIAQDSAPGGSGNARFIDSCPAQTFTIPSNSGSTRVDELVLQYVQAQTNPHSVQFANNTLSTVYNALESCQYQYFAGTTTPPSGYLAFAYISVPNGATTASQATVSYQFPTMQSQLSTMLGGVLNSVNSLTGAVTIAAGTNMILTPSGQTLTLGTVTNPTFIGTVTTGPLVSTTGNFSGAVTSQSSIYAGSVNGLTLTAGDLGASRSTTTGALTLGGSGASCTLDYNVATASTLTVSCPEKITGGLTTTTGTFSGLVSANAGLSATTGAFSNTITSTSSIYAGSGRGLALSSAGDLGASRSTTTGALILGGSGSSCTEDYGVTTSTVLTVTCAETVQGALIATSGTFSGAVYAGSGRGLSLTSGDLGASRSTSTGAIKLGGSGSQCVEDYGVTTSSTLTFSCASTFQSGVTSTTGAFSGAVTSPTVAKFYHNATQLTSSPHIESFTGSINATTLNLAFGASYASPPTCVASVSGAGGHTIYINPAPTTSQVSIFDGASDTYYVICTDQ